MNVHASLFIISCGLCMRMHSIVYCLLYVADALTEVPAWFVLSHFVPSIPSVPYYSSNSCCCVPGIRLRTRTQYCLLISQLSNQEVRGHTKKGAEALLSERSENL